MRCSATTARGTRCNTPALTTNTGLCLFHDPDAAERRRAGAVNGGSKPRARATEKRAPRYSLPPATAKLKREAVEELDQNLRDVQQSLAADGIELPISYVVRAYHDQLTELLNESVLTSDVPSHLARFRDLTARSRTAAELGEAYSKAPRFSFPHASRMGQTFDGFVPYQDERGNWVVWALPDAATTTPDASDDR